MAKRSKAGRTDGRDIQIDGEVRLVRWMRGRLDSHYAKHPAGRDEGCWADLTGSTRATRQDYERASYAAIEDARVDYQCINPRHSDQPRRHFLNEALVCSITPEIAESDDEVIVLTCMHKHFGGPYRHVQGEHEQPFEPRLFRLLDDINNLQTIGEIESLKINKPEWER